MDHIIHLGVPKTGSTSIQDFCFRNARLLLKAGHAAYPKGWGARGQHVGLAAALLEGREAEAAAYVAECFSEAKAGGARLMAWSSERLSKVDEEILAALRRLLEERAGAGRVRVVVYYRNIAERLVSRLNQMTKKNTDLVDDALLYRRLTREESPAEQVRRYERVFGSDNVQVRILELAGEHGGLERDFCAVAGIEWSDAFKIRPPVNVSLDPITAQLVNLLRYEFDLDGAFIREIEEKARKIRLPALTAYYMQMLEDAPQAFDIAHPKLEPHREILLARRRPDASLRPELDDFLAYLGETIETIRSAQRRQTARQGARHEKPRAP